MSVGFILDTNVISQRSLLAPDPAVVAFLDAPHQFYIPIAVLVEIQTGINEVLARSPRKAVQLCNWYARMLADGMPILSMGPEVATVYSALLSDPRLKSLRAGQDLQIAATSLVYRIPIATLDTADFLLINSFHPLPGVYSPKSDVWHARIESLEGKLTQSA